MPAMMFKNLPKVMRAVGFYKYLPLSDANSIFDLEVNLPSLRDNDVLVEVKATSVNPIDTKLRALKPTIEGKLRILGYDGAGIVVDKGSAGKLFNIGDEVFYIGDFSRDGSNAQYVALNEILVGMKPKNLTFEQAAAMPLTSFTAYESLYDRLLLSQKDKGKSLLIVNSGGGVGSVASQMAKNLGLNVIGTASRPDSIELSRKCGVDVVLDHKQDLIPQLFAHGYGKGVDYILVNYDPFPYWKTLMEAIKPQGKICLIVDSNELFDLKLLKDKSVTLVSEMMGTRIKYNTEDIFRVHEILQDISKMLADGRLKHTLTKTISPFNAASIREAHKIIESKSMIGKLVISGF